MANQYTQLAFATATQKSTQTPRSVGLNQFTREVIHISFSGFSIKNFGAAQPQEARRIRISIEVSSAALLSGQLIGQFLDLVRS
jgi:hypothetical protein